MSNTLRLAPRPAARTLYTDPYDPRCNSSNFDVAGWLAGYEQRLMSTPAGRRVLTRYDPLLFAVLYLGKHIKTDGLISFADAHFDWARYARKAWTSAPPPGVRRSGRRAFVAPRDTGKSTWWFLLLPMWAAGHGHLKFIAAFAHSGPQAELHLHTFRQELADNGRLRQDYPDLCSPARKPNGKTTADNIQMLRTKAGFTFAARGVDAASLGMKVDERRPDLLLLDDVEPDEASYSVYQMQKRRGTILEAILPMNLRAHVVAVGTVTMPNSIVHQLVRHARGDRGEKDFEWIEDERFHTHHSKPVVTDGETGEERSIWPVKWPLSFLRTIRHTRTYKKNFDNDPMGVDGDYWVMEDFVYGDLPGVTFQVLSVDPKISTKNRTDPAGLAVLGFAPGRVDRDERGRKVRIPSRCSVEYAQEFMLVGEALRTQVLKLLVRFPRVRVVLVEANQGGENWHAILHDLPPGARLRIVYSSEPKEVRAANLLERYQTGHRMWHRKRLPALEQQMVAFPKAGADDLVDAVGAAALRLLAPPQQKVGTIIPR